MNTRAQKATADISEILGSPVKNNTQHKKRFVYWKRQKFWINLIQQENMYVCYVEHVMAGRQRHFSVDGKKLDYKGWIFFLPPSNFLFVLGSDVGKTRLSFLNLRLEKCTCSWLVEKKRGSKRLRANLPQASSE